MTEFVAPSKKRHRAIQTSPIQKVVIPSYVYYLDPKYCTDDIHSLHSTDLELFELTIILHKDVKKLSLRAFQQEFNAAYISDEGYIIIK